MGKDQYKNVILFVYGYRHEIDIFYILGDSND